MPGPGDAGATSGTQVAKDSNRLRRQMRVRMVTAAFETNIGEKRYKGR